MPVFYQTTRPFKLVDENDHATVLLEFQTLGILYGPGMNGSICIHKHGDYELMKLKITIQQLSKGIKLFKVMKGCNVIKLNHLLNNGAPMESQLLALDSIEA